MNKISNYVENVFAGLPKSKEVIQMKLDILETMQEKYQQLMNEGKNEDEAFGIVISEFGSIDEIKAELSIKEEQSAPSSQSIIDPLESDEEYRIFRKRFALAITIGVVICVLGVITFLLLDDYYPNSNFPIVVLLAFAVIPVFLFVYFGIQYSRYEEIKAQYLERFETPKQIAKKNTVRLADALYAVVMLTATAVFLLFGFLQDAWHPAWVSFVIGGLLCGIIASIDSIGSKKDT